MAKQSLKSESKAPRTKKDVPGASERAYLAIRKMIKDYTIKPGDRLNEVELAGQIEISRPPLREALNRIASERLLDFEPSVGFMRPPLRKSEITDIYQLRVILETNGLSLALAKPDPAAIEALIDFWDGVNKDLQERSREQRIQDDEEFHERLISLSGNKELVAALKNVNARIHFVRWATVSGDNEHRKSYQQHRELLEAMKSGDNQRAIETLEALISRRAEDIEQVIKSGAAELYTF